MNHCNELWWWWSCLNSLIWHCGVRRRRSFLCETSIQSILRQRGSEKQCWAQCCAAPCGEHFVPRPFNWTSGKKLWLPSATARHQQQRSPSARRPSLREVFQSTEVHHLFTLHSHVANVSDWLQLGMGRIKLQWPNKTVVDFMLMSMLAHTTSRRPQNK